MHEDTGRRHIHIVTTCVDENGRKIDSRYEWRRSMSACRELEEKYGLTNSAIVQKPDEPRLKKVDHTQDDLKRQISNTLKSVVASYKFQTFGEFSALLACYNIEAKQVRGEHEGAPYTGIVYTATNERGEAVGAPFKSSLFGQQFGHDALAKKMARHAAAFRQRKWSPTIRDTVRLAMHACRGDREKFEQTLCAKGLDVVFRTNEQGRIYGMTFVDHNAREVLNGSRLGKEFSANTFQQLFAAPTQKPLDFPGLDLAPHTDPEPYDDTLYVKKRKKKKLCKTTTI